MMRIATAVACLWLPLTAQGATIKLFGQVYRVQTFDTAVDVTWEDESPLAAGPVQLIAVEGTHYEGQNQLLFSTQELGEETFGAASNQILRVSLDADECNNITGISYHSTVWTNDPAVDFTDFEPSGLTINTGNTGFGAGGNVVFCDDEIEAVHDVDLQTGITINGFFATGSFNTDLEDIAYCPTNDQLYTLRQDTPQLVRFSTSGLFLGSFPIGAASNPQATGEPKGVTFVADSDQAPAAIRRAEGTMMVALEEGGVALQVFELDGNELALEKLTDDAGMPRLPGVLGEFQIASLGFDSVTGRIFLTNEGIYDAFNGVAYDNLLWVLTPAIPGDGNSDGQVTGADYTIWADNFGSTTAGFEQGDFNSDGTVTGADYTIWADHFGQCGPGGGPDGAAAVPEPSTMSLALLAGALVAWRSVHRKR